MPRLRTRLSNCYVPQPVPTSSEQAKGEASGKGRRDRETHALRQLVLQSSAASPSASGTCLVELGHTKILCRVLAPLMANSPYLPPSVQLSMDEGTLHCEVKYASQFAYPLATLLASTVSSTDQTPLSSGRMNSWIMTRETELSSRLSTALSSAIPLQAYPKCALLVQVTVLQDDGSLLSAALLGASVALGRARVDLLDTVTASSVALVRSEDDAIWADPTLDESLQAKAVVTLAGWRGGKEVTLWEQSGDALSPEETNRALELCRDGCRTFQRFVREHLTAEFLKEEEANL
jgi:exosome complex component MTR3